MERVGSTFADTQVRSANTFADDNDRSQAEAVLFVADGTVTLVEPAHKQRQSRGLFRSVGQPAEPVVRRSVLDRTPLTDACAVPDISSFSAQKQSGEH